MLVLVLVLVLVPVVVPVPVPVPQQLAVAAVEASATADEGQLPGLQQSSVLLAAMLGAPAEVTEVLRVPPCSAAAAGLLAQQLAQRQLAQMQQL